MIKLLFMYEVQFKNIGGLETINKIFEQTFPKRMKNFFIIYI